MAGKDLHEMGASAEACGSRRRRPGPLNARRFRPLDVVHGISTLRPGDLAAGIGVNPRSRLRLDSMPPARSLCRLTWLPCGLFFLASMGLPTSLNSQQPFDPISEQRSKLPGTDFEDGVLAGSSAAEAPSVSSHGVAGFIGGLPLGLLGIVALKDRDSPQIVGAGGGLALIAAATLVGPAEPPADLLLAADERGRAYAAGFITGYETRLRSRQRRAALVGGLAGVGAGLGLLILALSGAPT